LFEDNTGFIEGGAINGSVDSLLDCQFIGNEIRATATDGSAFNVYNAYVDNCLIVGNYAFNSAPVYVMNTTLENSTIVGNQNLSHFPPSGAIRVGGSGTVIRNTIIAFNDVDRAVNCNATQTVTVECSNFYGNYGDDWAGCVSGQLGLNGNISLDPRFCDYAASNYGLLSSSPCFVASCGIMGAYGMGCWAEEPAIVSISDVGNDQGRQARIAWIRSLYDAPADTVDISGYGVFRRQEENLVTEPIRNVDGAPALLGWDYVGSHPVNGDSVYQMIVPTLCDSTISEGDCWSTFMVRAMTDDPFAYFDSDPDSGYSLDNLAPSPPAGFLAAYNTEYGTVLSWEESQVPDFDYFRIYRGTSRDFETSPGNLEHATSGTSWIDGIEHGYLYYYKTTTVDFSGNESEPSGPYPVTAASEETVPRRTVLYQNSPNPFNSTTNVSFALAERSHVELSVYGVDGSVVTILVSDVLDPGVHEYAWNGRDANGQSVSSGVYFYRMNAGELTDTKKMVLLK
jgi:hypothetical protein